MTGKAYNQIIHLSNPEHPGEGICGTPTLRSVYHKTEDMDYILNSMWPDDLLCEHCKNHPDWPLHYLAAI